jgi:protoporphyrinogen oxidase
MTEKQVAVIGAGPAGLTAAYQLSKLENFKVTIFESSNSVGGMARTIKLWDQFIDVGPHRFFSSDPRVNEIWLEAVDNEYKMVNRLTRIYYKSKFFDYPLKPGNALKNLGVIQACACVASYVFAQLRINRRDETFQDWVTNRFGKKLFDIFFKSYSEKLWGISCTDLDSDFATQRIKKLSLYEAAKSAFFGNRGNKHKTLVDEFAYPVFGAGAVYERMAAKFVSNSGKIFFNSPVQKISVQGSAFNKARVLLKSGEEFEFDHIVSTMPITHLVNGLSAPTNVQSAANSLRFRNTILVYLKIKGKSPFPDQWIYVHSAELKTGRITNFSNWVPEINNEQEDTILCLEYWCFDDDKWSSDDESLIQTAVNDIHKTKLIGESKVIDGHVLRVPKCYPVYATGYKQPLKIVEEYLDGFPQLSVIGRYGSFKYNNQDHSILMGLLAAENIGFNAKNNLWEINTDYEYQESSKITATGLAKS